MIEMVVHGRGGRGRVTLAKLIAAPRFLRGKYVQAFGLYGTEREGGPVQAFVRVDDGEMILHTPIDEPDHVIVIDPSLIRRDVAQRMKPGGTIVLRKVRRALDTRGFRFLLFLSPCPSGWKSDPAAGIDLIGLAVGCGLFAPYKVFDGQRFRINARPDGTPIEDYLSRQGRFRSATVDVDAMRADFKQFWAHLERLEEAHPEPNDGRDPPHASTLRDWAPLL